jgi:hypothetical protein
VQQPAWVSERPGARLASRRESAVPGLENVEPEGRGFAALATLAAGLAAAGIISGLGGILGLKMADWRERHE